MKVILLCLTSSFALATGAFAQAEPPTMRNFAKSMAQMNNILNHCEFDAPELAQASAHPTMDKALDRFRDALIERAVSLGVGRSDAAQGVETYMVAFDKPPANMDAFRAFCTTGAAANLIKSLGAVQSPGYQAMLTTYANGSHYANHSGPWERSRTPLHHPPRSGVLAPQCPNI